MNEWLKRGLWGSLFVVIVITCLIAGFLPLLGLILLVSSICIYEYLKMMGLLQTTHLVYAFLMNFMILGLVELPTLKLILGSSETILAQFLLVLFVFLIAQLWRYKTEFLQVTTLVVFSNLYISVPFLLFLIGIPTEETYDFRAYLFVFLLVWSSDTFAYIAGRLLGKRLLLPELSPKKTVEGFFGGAVLSAGVGALFSFFWKDIFTLTDGLVLGFLVAIFGTLGDLFESALKRKAGVKDSGKILPGHGGALDRFDAFIFAAVVVYIYFGLKG